MNNVRSYAQRRSFFTCVVSLKSYEALPRYHTLDANFYTVLEIDFEASNNDIKRAYFKRSKTCHPDMNTTDSAKAQYKDVRDAYEVLGNPNKREQYDTLMKRRQDFGSDRKGTRYNKVDEWIKSAQKDGFYKNQEQMQDDLDKKFYGNKTWEEMDPFYQEDLEMKRQQSEFFYGKPNSPMHPGSKEFKNFERAVMGFKRNPKSGGGVSTSVSKDDFSVPKNMKFILVIYTLIIGGILTVVND